MRVAILSSGGKDSAAAWWWAICKGWDITALVTMKVVSGDSMMFQVPGTEIVQHQAKLTNVPWLCIDTGGVEEIEITDLENQLSSLDIDALVCGALRSDYQKSRIERMCQRLEIISYTPPSPSTLNRYFVDNLMRDSRDSSSSIFPIQS